MKISNIFDGLFTIIISLFLWSFIFLFNKYLFAILLIGAFIFSICSVGKITKSEKEENGIQINNLCFGLNSNVLKTWITFPLLFFVFLGLLSRFVFIFEDLEEVEDNE